MSVIELSRLPASFFVTLYLRIAQLGGIGLFSLGLSGLLAEPASWLLGTDFIAGNQRLRQFSVERCAYLTEPRFGQPDCATGAVYHAFVETVTYGLVIAAFGLLVWGVHSWALRRVERTEYDAFVRRVYLTLGTLAFLIGTSLFLPVGAADVIANPGLGGGRTLLVGVVALAFLLGFATRLWRDLRSPP